MAPVQVRLLGKPVVATDSGVVRFPSRKAESLLAYLVVNPNGATRGNLANALWPEAAEDRARRNLSTALWRVKMALRGVSELSMITSKDSVCVRLASVDVDVFRFKLLAENSEGAKGGDLLDTLIEAEALYRGDFLDDFQDEWCEEPRRYLRELYVRLLKRLVASCKANGHLKESVEFARKVVEIDPMDEDAQRELMSLYHLTGDRDAALRQYESVRRILKSELGVEPTQATNALWHYIRSHPQHSSATGFSVAVVDDVLTSESSSEVPIVGRDKQLAQLLSHLADGLRGRGTSLLISGESGVGKTRLIEALAVEAGLRGFQVLRGSCPDAHATAPYQVFIEALWPRIMEAQRRSGEDSSPLSTLMKALASGSPTSPEPSGTIQSARLLENSIVIETLLGLLLNDTTDSPALLVLEDCQRAERASVNLLASLLRRVQRAKLVVVVSVRDDESRSSEVMSLLIANGAAHLHLDPLSEGETGKLLQAVLRNPRIPPMLTKFVWDRTNGIPLYVLEYLKLIRAEGLLTIGPSGRLILVSDVFRPDAFSVPSQMHELILRRIQALAPKCQSILNAAAVLGTDVDFDHLRELVEIPEEEFVDSVDELVRAELLVETERGLRFPHETVRLVALSTLSRGRKRRLHLRVGALMERTVPGRVEDLAWHFGEGGDYDRALKYSEAAGDRASAVHANGDAVMWYSRALQWVSVNKNFGRLQLNRRARILLKRQKVLDLLGNRQDQSHDIDAIETIAQSLGDRKLLAEAFLLRASLFTRLNAATQALRFLRKAARLFREVRDLKGEARAEEVVGSVYQSVRRYDSAEKFFRRALGLFCKLGDTPGRATCLFNIGTTLAFKGKDSAALAHLNQADVLLDRTTDRRARAHVYLQKGILLRYMGKLALSEFYVLSGVEVMRRIGDRVGEARGLSQLGLTHAAMGKLRDALHESERALRMATAANDVRARITILNNAACGVLRMLGLFGRAQRYVINAMTLVRGAGRVENQTTYVDTMAAVLLEQGDLSEAFRWSRLSRTRYRAVGAKNYMRAEVGLRLGRICVELRRYDNALRELRSARQDFTRNGEFCLQLQAVEALARLCLDRGNLSRAAKYATELSRLLKKVDGVEQIQNAYWTRFRVLNAVGQPAGARRALRQAYSVVMHQASGLKGPLRRRFLEVIGVNRMILDEVANRGIRGFGDDALPLQQAPALDPPISRTRLDNALNLDPDASIPTPVPALGRMAVERRRKTLVRLLGAKRMTQKEVAERLGVSVRTVRYDAAALRRSGLIGGSSKPRVSQPVG